MKCLEGKQQKISRVTIIGFSDRLPLADLKFPSALPISRLIIVKLSLETLDHI